MAVPAHLLCRGSPVGCSHVVAAHASWDVCVQAAQPFCRMERGLCSHVVGRGGSPWAAALGVHAGSLGAALFAQVQTPPVQWGSHAGGCEA